MFEVEVICNANNELGESPIWLESRQEIIWLDLTRRTLHRLHTFTRQHFQQPIDVPGPLGAIVPSATSDQVVLLAPGLIGLLDLQTGEVTHRMQVERGREGMVCNDAKVDRSGRLWFGTCERVETEPRGALYYLDALGSPLLVDAGFIVPNGPAFSPDGAVMYVSDSIGGRILAYDIAVGPRLKNRRVFTSIEKSTGLPDGLTVDSEGCIWCAHWGGACISRFAPSGEFLISIPVPAKYVTSLTFGGASLDELFITTAKAPSPAESGGDLASAGSLLRVRPGISGTDEKSYNFFES